MFGDNPARNQWQIKFPPSYPPFSGISYDDEGRIYVKTYEKTPNDKGAWYDVFDREGKYLAKFHMEFPLMIIKKGYLYSIVEDSDGFKSFVRYKMTLNF